jgi:hypothetical protein
VTGSLPHGVSDAWSDLLSQALITTPDRMAARLAEPSQDEGSQSSALQRALFASLRCPEDLKPLGEANASAPAQLLPHIRLLHLDYEKTPSHDHARLLSRSNPTSSRVPVSIYTKLLVAFPGSSTQRRS